MEPQQQPTQPQQQPPSPSPVPPSAPGEESSAPKPGPGLPPQPQHVPVSLPDYSDPEPPSAHRKRSEGIKSILSTIIVIVAAIAFALLLITFVFHSYQVDGPSMETTLQNGDRLIIWKVPRTMSKITGKAYIPNRGDIIVFTERGLAAPDGSTKQLIKRVIGVPGDRIIIEDGTVLVKNKTSPDGFNPDKTLGYGDGENFAINTNEQIDEYIDDGEVFVMGDNRGNSMDSRVFGPVKAEDIIGKLTFRIFPIQSAEKF